MFITLYIIFAEKMFFIVIFVAIVILVLFLIFFFVPINIRAAVNTFFPIFTKPISFLKNWPYFRKKGQHLLRKKGHIFFMLLLMRGMPKIGPDIYQCWMYRCIYNLLGI